MVKKKKIIKSKGKKPAKIVYKKKTKGSTRPLAGKGSHVAYLALGSNMGDRDEYIEQAIFLLEKNSKIEIISHSRNYESEPEGGPNQPLFLNAAISIRTTLSPLELLDVCQEIETSLGREREMEWGPRTIDIDILLYGNEIISNDRLQIPHPLMHERLFVLQPLAEIASKAIHPALEKKIDVLLEERKAETGEQSKYDDELPGFKEIKGGGYDDFERW